MTTESKRQQVVMTGDIIHGPNYPNRPQTRAEFLETQRMFVEFLRSLYPEGCQIWMYAGRDSLFGDAYMREYTRRNGQWVCTKFAADDRVYEVNPDGSIGKRIDEGVL